MLLSDVCLSRSLMHTHLRSAPENFYFFQIVHVLVSPAVCVTIAHHKKPQLTLRQYYFKKKSRSSHSRNGKDYADDATNHDSRIQPRSPLSRQCLPFDPTTYRAAVVRRQAGVSDPYWVPWPPGWKRYDVSLVAGELLLRQVEELTEEVNGVKWHMEQLMCKDDGDFDAERAYNLLKDKYQCAVRDNEKLEKQVFCLKDICENVVEMNGELKKMASFKENMADNNDKLEEQITSLSNSFIWFKDQLVLALKMETERHQELAPSEAVPCTALYVGSGDQMIPRTDGTVIQGARPVIQSNSLVCKPQGRRLFSTSRAENADLDPLFAKIGPVHNLIHWHLNGPLPTVQSEYDQLIGHIRLNLCLHGQALDVSSLLGPKKLIFSTAKSGTQYVRVSYEDSKQYNFTMIVDGRELWNYAWQNEHGIFEYKDSALNPYIIDGRKHVDFLSSYSPLGLCPYGHGITLLGPEAVQVCCKIMSTYDGTFPSPLQVRVACAVFINYLIEAVKLHDVHYMNSMSLSTNSVCTLDECDIGLSAVMRRWKRLSFPQIHFLINQLYCQSAPFNQIDGLSNLETLMGAVAISPFNVIPKSGNDNKRTWTSYAMDNNSDGKPHPLSLDFLKQWPYNAEVIQMLPETRKVNMTVAGPLATPQDLERKGILNLVKTIKPVAGRHTRMSLFTSSDHALNVLDWLKEYV